MQFQLLPALLLALLTLATSVIASTAVLEAAAIPRNTLPYETVSPPSDGSAITTPTTIHPQPISPPNSTLTPIHSPTLTPTATNASRGIGLDNLFKVVPEHSCAELHSRSRDDILYACERKEKGRRWTLVFIRRDESYLAECRCVQGLESSYPMWDKKNWMMMRGDLISTWCYRRTYNSMSWWTALNKINNVNCPTNAKYCDTKNGTNACTYRET